MVKSCRIFHRNVCGSLYHLNRRQTIFLSTIVSLFFNDFLLVKTKKVCRHCTENCENQQITIFLIISDGLFRYRNSKCLKKILVSPHHDCSMNKTENKIFSLVRYYSDFRCTKVFAWSFVAEWREVVSVWQTHSQFRRDRLFDMSSRAASSDAHLSRNFDKELRYEYRALLLRYAHLARKLLE